MDLRIWLFCCVVFVYLVALSIRTERFWCSLSSFCLVISFPCIWFHYHIASPRTKQNVCDKLYLQCQTYVQCRPLGHVTLGITLQWRQNMRDGVSNHRRLGCLLDFCHLCFINNSPSGYLPHTIYRSCCGFADLVVLLRCVCIFSGFIHTYWTILVQFIIILFGHFFPLHMISLPYC